MRKALPLVVATPFRTVCDDNARVAQKLGLLRLYALGTRRGTPGIPTERTSLNPWIGLWSYATAKALGGQAAESCRFAMHPWFDRWVLGKLRPGDSMLSSYGHTNRCFEWVREHGGMTFLDGGNSHPSQFWEILEEEHRRWKSPYPPVARFHHERSLRMLEHVDYVLSPSRYVTDSFLTRGFGPDRVLPNPYPVNTALFAPRSGPRPDGRPLRVVNTGGLSLRKGTPYLLEAFRAVQREVPGAQLCLTRHVAEGVRPILAGYGDLNIEWSEGLPHAALAERLRSCDIFVLPSLEEGLARTSIEAMACGLPIVVTPHTGSNDYVREGVNGSVVPIRDAGAIAAAILSWWTRIREAGADPVVPPPGDLLSFARFEQTFVANLRRVGLLADGVPAGPPHE